ncbi:PGRS family protein [Sorangium sp. So ce887]|uniref:PGRS family protein n=1 Tax=Sorangium sp. So ce887 TaxID=3133324 RepID=UPI003F61B6FA
MEQAIALATARTDPKTKNVYACAETFNEVIEIQADVTLLGGLDCENGWRWIGEQTRTTLTADPGAIPLTMHEDIAVRIEDFDVVASSIPQDDPAMLGASSIAAVADGVTVSLARCTIAAGDGAQGATGRQYTDNAKSGEDGNPGLEACMPGSTPGGEEEYNDCDDGVEDSIGGSGGLGQTSSGAPGIRGTPGGSDNGGTGQASTANLCTNGDDGAPGVPGMPGAGAGATDLGTLSRNGYTGVPGQNGTFGVTAQGGGGGGGARGIPNVANPMPARTCPGVVKGVGGASGGSGGSGGCGGKGGLGGAPGGASIALVSLYSTLEFHGVTLKTGRGGGGGNGGPGQRGGDGSPGGAGGKPPADSSGLDDACAGGRGGRGGNGGIGGGGRGGHSIGLAYLGTPPPMDANELSFDLGDAGLGGEGDENAPVHDGAPGAAEPTLDFTPP